MYVVCTMRAHSRHTPKCQAFRVPFLVPNSDMFLPVAHRRMREWGLQNVGKLFCIVAVLLDAAVRS